MSYIPSNMIYKWFDIVISLWTFSPLPKVWNLSSGQWNVFPRFVFCSKFIFLCVYDFDFVVVGMFTNSGSMLPIPIDLSQLMPTGTAQNLRPPSMPVMQVSQSFLYYNINLTDVIHIWLAWWGSLHTTKQKDTII